MGQTPSARRREGSMENSCNETDCNEWPPKGGCSHICNKPEYRGWHIDKNIKPITDRQHDYDFWHDDYDGADGGNGLAGTASSHADALAQITEIEANTDTSEEAYTRMLIDNLATDPELKDVLLHIAGLES